MDNNTLDYELTLFDRLNVIRDVNKQHDLEHNAYLSFSGGKDSTILHYLLDMALPNNRIPRVFINTGIEYNDIVAFVKELAKQDDRFVILKPSVPIKPMLEKFGYPFKSKEHTLRVEQFNRGTNAKFIQKYLGKTDYKGKYMCPKILLYQFEEKGKYNYSNLCCQKLKKEPIHKWQKENKKTITLTGMRADEGGNRQRLGCIITDSRTKKVVKFHPLIKVNDEWENEFVEHENIKLCKLYYPPYNFARTGCKGCPFALTLAEQLETMAKYLPNERKQCEVIWKPVYDEYRRLNYRLSNQMSIFDYKEENE